MPTAIKKRIKLHSCPRCQGTLFLELGFYVDERVCLNCGYRVETMEEINELKTSGRKEGEVEAVSVMVTEEGK